jgi:hypothetical protein
MNLDTSDLKLACTRIAGISSNFFTNLEVVGLGCLGRVTIREGKVAMFIRGGRGGAPSIRGHAVHRRSRLGFSQEDTELTVMKFFCNEGCQKNY